MGEIKNPYIKLKGTLNKEDYNEIVKLEKISLEVDKTTLKLELDYKIRRAEGKSGKLNNINEFMYYDENKLIGYIGICHFGGTALEVNGMVDPNYRRKGVFKKLFSLVKDEWNRREFHKILLLSDNNSISGLEFIKSTGAVHAHSEYEMFLKNSNEMNKAKNVILRNATNKDVKEIARQNSIYFSIECKEEDIALPEEEEKCGNTIYMAELHNKIIGKVHLGIEDGIGGIYGLGVLPEYRGKGYGREILITAIEKLKAENTKDIMLQVEAKNKNALNLYKSCGFEETSTMDYYQLNK